MPAKFLAAILALDELRGAQDRMEGELTMIGRVVVFLAFVCFATTALAQEPACTFYKVDTNTLQISKEAGGDRYIDALFDGDVACVTRKENLKGVEWGFVAGKLESLKKVTAVNGWALLQRLKPISAADAAALLAAATPTAAPGPNSASGPAASKVPPNTAATAAAHPEDVLHFDQPVPFGPYPVNGHSLKELTNSVPMFSPVEGLDENLWKKKCSSCHQWNKDSLCKQALTYLRAPKDVLRIQHPFGGTLKVALMRWARSGCE
jgi:hypothetical protein